MLTSGEICALARQALKDPDSSLPLGERAGELAPLVELVNELVRENRVLRRNHAVAADYIRRKVDQLLAVIGTVPLRPEELDDATLISLDPIGIVTESFRRILEHSRFTNEQLSIAMREIQVIFDAVGGGVLVLDGKKRILSCNHKVQEMFAPEGGEIVGRTCREIICRTENPPGCVFEEMMRFHDVGKSLFFCPQDLRHFNVVASPVKDSNGEIVRAVLLYHDITELVQAKASVAEEKERLFFTLASIAEGVIATDQDGRITMMNQVAEKLTGWSSEEAFGLPICDVLKIFDEGNRQICLDILGNALLAEEVGETLGKTILRTRDGAELLFTMSAAPIRRQDSTVAGAIVVFRDVTREKRWEEEMIKSARIESLGLLAGGIAHDFNNLLTAMLGNVSLAKMLAEPGSRLHDLLSRTENASSRARNLTQQLLTFAKGGTPLKSLVSLKKLLREAADFALSGSTVKCEFSLPDDLWPVEVDEGQFGQVVQNLMLNAVQAMPDGGVARISAENFPVAGNVIPSLAGGRYVRIAVQDHGMGIPRQDLNRIFDPYFTTKELGHGLGLTICYSIIQKHQGHISVQSEPGVGTTFFILLPASEKEFAGGATTIAGGREEAGPGNGRILVMDDEEVVRDVASQMIAFLGYQVEQSRNGEETLAMYASAMEKGRPYDAVIMDLTIPGGMGGKETVEKLLAMDPGVRAIVSSGYANDPIMADFRLYGFSGVVPKPYSMQELADVLESVLKGADCGG